MVEGKTSLGHRCLAGQFLRKGIPIVSLPQYMVGQDMFQKQVEGMSVILMTKMTKFMKKHIIPEYTRETQYAQIEIDVSF